MVEQTARGMSATIMRQAHHYIIAEPSADLMSVTVVVSALFCVLTSFYRLLFCKKSISVGITRRPDSDSTSNGMLMASGLPLK